MDEKQLAIKKCLELMKDEMPDFFNILADIGLEFSNNKEYYMSKYPNIDFGTCSGHIDIETKEEADGGLLITLSGKDELGREIITKVEEARKNGAYKS